MASNNKHFLVKYGECMHNYAASTMGYALDGCGEFCPNGTLDSLICAACHCHRNFHRKMEMEVEVETQVELSILSNTHHNRGTSLVIVVPPTPTFQQQSRIHPRQKYGKNNVVATPPQGAETATEMGGGEIEVVEQMSTKRKRINSEQKERVKAFAEKIGWRWTKYNKEVKPFCAEIGITPYFLKNWIDNNRRRFGPKKVIKLEKEGSVA